MYLIWDDPPSLTPFTTGFWMFLRSLFWGDLRSTQFASGSKWDDPPPKLPFWDEGGDRIPPNHLVARLPVKKTTTRWCLTDWDPMGHGPSKPTILDNTFYFFLSILCNSKMHGQTMQTTTSLFTCKGGLVIKDLRKMASTARGKSL